MVIEKKKTLLATLTHISDSAEVREYEHSFLRRYSNLMRNRQNFYVNQQKASQGSYFDGFFDSLKKRDN